MQNSSGLTTLLKDVFTLIRQTPPGDAQPASTINLLGKDWEVVTTSLPDEGRFPKYTCISYAWGVEKEFHPVLEGLEMSARVLPVLDTVIKVFPDMDDLPYYEKTNFIWMDAFCIPPSGPSREICLQNIGLMYGKAAQVVVVLSKESGSALNGINQNTNLDIAALELLQKDDWVSRAWTYQEIVNAQAIYFIAEGGSKMTDSQSFLSNLGRSIHTYKKEQGYDGFAFANHFPILDSFESVLVDWQTGQHGKRSAYQILSAMHLRKSEKLNDLAAVIGTILRSPLGSIGARLPAAEEFMRTCESKEDFSFLYTVAPRSKTPGRTWRPASESLPTILPYLGYGEKQSGTLFSTHLLLANVCFMHAGKQHSIDEEFMRNYFSTPFDCAANNYPESILGRLKRIGFSGCGAYLETEDGYFFYQDPVILDDSTQAIIASEVRWAFGAPGLLVKNNGSDIYHYYSVGIFVGIVPENATSIKIA